MFSLMLMPLPLPDAAPRFDVIFAFIIIFRHALFFDISIFLPRCRYFAVSLPSWLLLLYAATLCLAPYAAMPAHTPSAFAAFSHAAAIISAPLSCRLLTLSLLVDYAACCLYADYRHCDTPLLPFLSPLMLLLSPATYDGDTPAPLLIFDIAAVTFIFAAAIFHFR